MTSLADRNNRAWMNLQMSSILMAVVAKALRYGIIGTGAVGGYYGAQLVTAGCDVHFLVHSDFRHIQKHGLRMTTPKGVFTLPVRVYAQTTDMPRCDVLLVTLKATKNHLLPRLLAPVVKRGGLIVLLQNGIGWEEKLASLFPHTHMAAGLAFLCSTKIGPGHIQHLDYGAVTLAPYAGSQRTAKAPAILKRVAADFRRAGVPVRILPDLVLARWKKLVWNIPFNGLSVVHNALTDKLVSDAALRKEVLALMDEVVRGARALGRHIPRLFVQKMIRDTERMKPYRTSMKVDFDRGRPMEVEAILGNPLRMARAAGVELPKLAHLYRQLKALNAPH
jgi:2-dehydropantoate 2-reductase